MREIRFPSFARNSDEQRTREVEAVTPSPLFPFWVPGKKLSLSRQVDAHLAALHLERQRENWPPHPSLAVPRESAAILYIAKSFTISLGTFIIPQLNPPCFAAKRYRGRFNLSFHFSPDYRGLSVHPKHAPSSRSRLSLFVLGNFSFWVESRERSVLMRFYSPIRWDGTFFLNET